MSDPQNFIKVVERSHLPAETKREFYAAAKNGISSELWSRLNDLLIDDLTHRQEARRQSSRQLDQEIDRYTAEYEREKTALDRQMMDQLREVGNDEKRRQQLWKNYRKQIAKIQREVVGDVKRTSATVLRQVVLTVAHLPLPR